MILTPLYRLAYFEVAGFEEEAISAILEATLLLPTGMESGTVVDMGFEVVMFVQEVMVLWLVKVESNWRGSKLGKKHCDALPCHGSSACVALQLELCEVMI